MEKYGLTRVTLAQLMAEREQVFRQIAPGRLRPFPGLTQVMAILKARRIQTALASSAETTVVLANLAIAGIDPTLFDVIVDSSLIPHKKPAPDIFLQAATDLGLSPATCVVVEDSVPGIQAGKRAGMRVVAVATSLPRAQLIEADVVADSIEDLISIFEQPGGVNNA
jgi:HAD superfamily hydrolase (TIGR01509 family)